MAISYLPQEMLTNIFARLPVETLSNVILVNKSYLRLISSRDFARAHLEYSKQGKSSNFSDLKCIFATSSNGHLLKQFSFASFLSNSTPINVVDLDYPKNRLLTPLACLVGSCNGLVCIVLREKHVFLWNPCTRKYKKLPRLAPHLNYKENGIDIAYAFVYDESNDDYKVVALCSSSPKNCTEETWTGYHYEIYVFSLKRNSWKRILQDLKGQHFWGFFTGKLMSGKVHWLSEHNTEDFTRTIVSFDVESEVFQTVELPSNLEFGSCYVPYLQELEGCICLLMRREQQTRVDVWVMKEYGIKESWTKVFTVSSVNIPDYYCCEADVLPNGEILFHSSEMFMVYNPREYSFRFPSITRPYGYTFKPVFYVPSLVSPVV